MSKSPKKAPAASDPGRRKKHWKATRIPAAYFEKLNELAAEHHTDVQDEVRVAVREYLERYGRLPAPPAPPLPPKA